MANDHRGVRAWHVLAGVLALGVAACAGILGIDDRQLDTSDGGTQQDGGSQDGPSTGDGPAMGDGPSTGDGPSQSETGSNCTSATALCVLATGLNHPFLMTSDSKNVYWTEFGDDLGSQNGTVRGCPIDGCGSGPTVYGTALINPRGVAVDANNVYFGTATYGSVVGAIWSCPIAGCNGTPTKLTNADSPFGVAVDSMYVYWADYDDSTVHRVPKNGGTENVLYDGGGQVYVGQAITYDTTSLYFTDENGNVYKMPIGGGSLTVMASWGTLGGWTVKVDSNWVYYGQPGGVSAMAKNATDGGPFVANNLQDPLGIALDPPTGRLYWADYGSGNGNDGTIGRVGTDGGGRFVVASSQVNVEDVTVSGNYVFWLSNGTMNDDAGNALPSTGELLRMPK
jgi:hypothetical protein